MDCGRKQRVYTNFGNLKLARVWSHIFFARYGASKIPGITDMGLLPRKINKVAVIGGGLMGSRIATVFILSNFHVILKEANENFLLAGIGRIKADRQGLVKKEKVTQEKLEKALSCLNGVLDYDSFKDVDLVIEAAPENLLLKQQIFADLEKYCPGHCVFASNTVTINLNLIGERTKSHNRIVGVQFFSPAHLIPFLEIVRTERTSPQVVVDLLDVGKKIKKIKKTSVVVGIALDLRSTGCSSPTYKQQCYSLNTVQISILLIRQLRTLECQWVRLGKSTRKGFYLYDDKGKARPDPEIMKYIEKARSISHTAVDSELAKLSVVNEACRILAEGIAVKASDLDVDSVMGMAFPAYRGGIVFWANSLGPKHICSRLEDWLKEYGEFFKTCAYLKEHALKGNPLGAQLKQVKSQL